MYCDQCHALNDDDAIFCKYCGTRLIGLPAPVNNDNVNVNLDQKDHPNNLSSPKSKIVTILLCFFFGTAGIHRFYTGNTFTGFIQLLLWLTRFFVLPYAYEIVALFYLVYLIKAFWVIIDFFAILFNRFTDGNGLVIS